MEIQEYIFIALGASIRYILIIGIEIEIILNMRLRPQRAIVKTYIHISLGVGY